MSVRENVPDESCARLLPNYTFADSHSVGTMASLDAPGAAAALFRSSPAWVTTLMDCRNLVARAARLRVVALGKFPVIEEGPVRVVLGLDDRHLDFRIVITVSETQGAQRDVTVTTLVRVNNLLGHAYLASVLPFHRRIARTMLKRAIFG